MIADDVSEIIKLELGSEEKLLWADKPRKLPFWTIGGGIAFLIMFFGFSDYPLIYALATGDKTIFASFTYTINGEELSIDSPNGLLIEGLMISGVLFAVIVPSFLIYLFSRIQEVYGLTNVRAIAIKPFPDRRTVSLRIRDITQMRRTGSQNIGSLTLFEKTTGLIGLLMRFYQVSQVSFMNVREPGRIEALILEKISQTDESTKS